LESRGRFIALRAFVLNMRIFEELDVKGGVAGATVRPLQDAIGYFDNCVIQQLNEKEGLTVRRSSDIKESEAKCPFAMMGGPNPHKVGHQVDSTASRRAKENQSGRCPWPFVFFHDPYEGMKDFQTWVVVGFFLSWIYYEYKRQVFSEF